MNGIEIAARFSYSVNKLGYCGPDDANTLTEKYLRGQTTDSELKTALCKFQAMYPYLCAIASKHGLQPFDKKVVEAYWIGNDLLDTFTPDDIKGILTTLMNRGLPPSIGKPLLSRVREGLFPHHNLHVFFIGVGQMTGSVPSTIETMQQCRVTSGIVHLVEKDTLTVETDMTIYDKGVWKTGKGLRRKIGYHPLFLPSVKIGDIVAVHWNFAPMILTKQHQKNLRNATSSLFAALS